MYEDDGFSRYLRIGMAPLFFLAQHYTDSQAAVLEACEIAVFQLTSNQLYGPIIYHCVLGSNKRQVLA